MKQFTIALLMSFCLAGFVSSKSHHSLRQRYYDSDEEPEYENALQCQASFEPCIVPLQAKFRNIDRDSTAAFAQIRQNGARALCSDVLTLGGCIKPKLEQATCQQGLPYAVKAILNKSWNFGQKLCVDRIDDLAKHWNCILSIHSGSEIEACSSLITPWEGCDVDKLVDCIAGIYSGKSECQAGSTQFIRDVLPDILDIANVCPTSGPLNFKRALKKFLRV